MLDAFNLLGTHLPRLVAPLFPEVCWRCPPRSADRRVAYLTFDDGPSPVATPQVLDLLRRYDARALFFLIGEHAAARPDIVHTILHEGHQIGNHSYTHRDPWLTRSSQMTREMEQADRLLEQLADRPVRWVRPPYGHLTPGLHRWCRRRKQHLAMWDVMPGDFLPWASPERLAARVVKLIRPGSVIVLHDHPRTRESTLLALELLLRRLTRAGWRFPQLESTSPRSP